MDRTATIATEGIFLDKFQWGHDFSAMDRLSDPPAPPAGGSFQWGHDFSAMDRDDSGNPIPAIFFKVSMGPRLFSHG